MAPASPAGDSNIDVLCGVRLRDNHFDRPSVAQRRRIADGWADDRPQGRSEKSDPTVVVHVTESFASGVAAAIRDYVRNYPSADHHLLYAPRTEAAVSRSDFDDFDGVTELPEGHVARVRFIRRFVNNLQRPVLIHAHSSKAGRMYVSR